MSKAIEKHLTIDIEYTDTRNLKEIFERIYIDLNHGKSFNRTAYGSSIYQYRKHLLILPDYREEKINGIWCMVYPSKINKK